MVMLYDEVLQFFTLSTKAMKMAKSVPERKTKYIYMTTLAINTTLLVDFENLVELISSLS
jgi:hypothetical protein